MLVNVGGQRASCGLVTCFDVPGRKVPLSLPQAAALAQSGTIVHADVQQHLPVGDLYVDVALWQSDWTFPQLIEAVPGVFKKKRLSVFPAQ
jgi:hypothetical protein